MTHVRRVTRYMIEHPGVVEYKCGHYDSRNDAYRQLAYMLLFNSGRWDYESWVDSPKRLRLYRKIKRRLIRWLKWRDRFEGAES